MLPIIRTSSGVGGRQDNRFRIEDFIDNVIWKSFQNAPSNISFGGERFEQGITIRLLINAVQRRLISGKEVLAEAVTLPLIPARGVDRFVFSEFEDSKCHESRP